uniref:Uncharacterized protein n=1 Tax=uncultured marine virus TaxID=186617 RepID=A0A0F7L4R5_9VIRU|nr:hypothetical protein [uncultured marine virus]
MTHETDQLEVENPDENLDSTQENGDAGELSKAQEIANNQRIRAEKAEAKLKKLSGTSTETETPKKDSDYSLKDIRALNDVHDDEVDELAEFAKFKGITIAEAKKTPTMKNLLHTRKEERATAEASSTGTTKKGTRRDSDDDVLSNFDKGKAVDESDIEKLVRAEHARKVAIAKSTP